MDNRMSLLTSPFVPEGMVDLMKKLSKGVIKEQPSNIYEYAAEFFEKMLIERDGSLDKGYGKFRSYTEYCKFMDKMDQRRLSQTTKIGNELTDNTDTAIVSTHEEITHPSNIEVQGVAIQGVERKNKDSVKNVSINPKYKSQSEKTAKPVVSSVKSVKTKPRKLSSKKPSKNLIVIKEETSADVDDSTNDVNLHKAAMTIQKAFRMYMKSSKKSSQDEHSSETFGNVSQLSEDAAAVIIQKAFKSLIQKLKPGAHDREKAVDESNNNIPGDGQENAIITNKNTNNTDDHSEQILVDDGRTEAEHDFEHKDTLHKNASEDTAASLDIETNETTNLQMITTLEARGIQQVESEEKKSSSDEGNNQLDISSDNNHEAGCNEDLASDQKNEPLVTSASITFDMETKEVTDTNEVLLGELKLEEVQTSSNEIAETVTDTLEESNESQIKNISDDPIPSTIDQAETETMKNVTEVELENKPNLSDDEKASDTVNETGHNDVTEPLNSSGTNSDVGHSSTFGNDEPQVVAPADTISVDPSENTSNIIAKEENLNDINENTEKRSSSTDNNLTEEKVPESPVKEQLFVVEKDGIYVNMDLLQEKFGTATIDTIDDGAGIDSEKTFKLNILEREEILVNQENVTKIEEEESIKIDKSIIAADHKETIVEGVESTEEPLSFITADDKEKIVEEVESTAASSCDIRDEEGNEEYELAETVVLMDIPSKSHLENESGLPEVDPEDECVDVTQLNKVNDEVNKFVSCADEKSLAGSESDSGKGVDYHINEEVAETGTDTTNVGEVTQTVVSVENPEIMEQQSNKIENPTSITNLDETTKDHNNGEKPKMKTEEDQIIEHESAAFDKEIISKEENMNNENDKVDSQLNLNELPEYRTEENVKKETVEKEPNKDEQVEKQSDENNLTVGQSEVLEEKKTKEDEMKINELPSSDELKAIIGEEESRNENEVQTLGSETAFEAKRTKNENSEVLTPGSENNEKEEAASGVDEAKTENVEVQTPGFEIIEKEEVASELNESENVEVQESGSKIIEKEEVASEVNKAENENVEVQASGSKIIEKEEVASEVNKAENENVEVQAPESKEIEEMEAMSEVKEPLNVEVEVTETEKIEELEAVNGVKKPKNEIVNDECSETDLIASNSEKIIKVEDGQETKNDNVGRQLIDNELASTETENISKVDAVDEIEAEKGEDQLDSNESQSNEKIVEMENIETKSDNLESQLTESDLISSETENIANVEAIKEVETKRVENILQNNEIQATGSKTVEEIEAVREGDEIKDDKVESQLSPSESVPSLSIPDNGSIKGSEIDESNSAQLEEKTNEEDVNSMNQTHEKYEENNVDTESKVDEKEDELIQEKTENLTRENVSSLTDEKNDVLSTKDESGTAETEISDQIIKNKENAELVKAATVIQKVFRGYIVRNSSAFNPNSKKNQPELWAALIIQKYARGYLVRKNMQKIDNLVTSDVTSNEIKKDENDANQTEDNSITNVVPQLPAYSNRFLIPKDSFLERESFADDEDYARTCKELAATSIQKTYRGYRVRRSLKSSTENDAESDIVHQDENEAEFFEGNDQIKTAVNEAERVISDVLNVATDVLPLDTYDMDSFEDEVPDERNVDVKSQEVSSKFIEDRDSVLGQVVHDNVHVEGQMQQKYNLMKFQDTTINPIEEVSDSSEQPETPPEKPTAKSKTIEFDSLDSKDYEGSKSFSYEQLSSDLSDTEENKRESMKESEVDETSRDERDDLSEVENFDLSSCGEDSLEAMYYSLRKNEIMVDRMQKQVAEQREPKMNEVKNAAPDGLKVEFPERVTENLDVAMHQVFKSMESSSDYEVGKKDDDDSSSTLDLALDDSSSINDEREIETSRHIKPTQTENLENIEQSESTTDHANDASESPEPSMDRDGETSNVEQSQQSDSSANSSTRFIMKSQSVSEDMMNPIMFAMKRKQALLDQLHVRPYPLQENLSEEHDAFPEHLLTDIDIGNIQRKIFASSVSETDSDYIEPNTTGRRLVRDDFNISTALDHLSTDSDSTIISAATKIQAGARGFLTRRRLRRSSAGGTSVSFEKRYSFGNAAIDKSLEDLIKMQEQINLDGAALKIQQQYRRYQARKNNLKKVSPIREQTTLELSGGSSIEGNEGTDDVIGIREITLAQKKADDCQHNAEDKIESPHPISLNIDTVETVEAIKRTPVNQRRLTLQRGDAVQRNSRPDSQDSNIKDGDVASPDNQSHEKCKDSETGEYIDTTNSKKDKKVTAYINIQSLINRGIGPRQRSMPVQIDSELMRIIPKHLRKRVKSADMAKKKNS